MNLINSLLRKVRATAAQDILLELACGGLQQLGDEVEALRDFEVGEVIACELAQIRPGRSCAVPEDDKGVRRFAPLLLRQTDDRHFRHRRMSITPLGRAVVSLVSLIEIRSRAQ